MSNVKTHKDLLVWQKSIDFVTQIYKTTLDFPKEEIYGITNQIRRAAVSIPSNIAEGSARGHDKENIQFLYIALGSATEIETQLIISNKLDFLNNESFNLLNESINEIRKMLIGLIKMIKNREN